MSSIPAFLSPRSDLTIRGVPPEKMEALVNAAVDILGGRVEFSETAIYESHQEFNSNDLSAKHCGDLREHPHHGWSFNNRFYACPGNSIEQISCSRKTRHNTHYWGGSESNKWVCPGLLFEQTKDV